MGVKRQLELGRGRRGLHPVYRRTTGRAHRSHIWGSIGMPPSSPSEDPTVLSRAGENRISDLPGVESPACSMAVGRWGGRNGRERKMCWESCEWHLTEVKILISLKKKKKKLCDYVFVLIPGGGYRAVSDYPRAMVLLQGRDSTS